MASTERPFYLDSSALVKLVVDEPQSAALSEAVGGRAVVTSELALAEVPRSVRRIGQERGSHLVVEAEGAVLFLLRRLSFVPLTRDLLLHAGAFAEPFLRTLDAVHLASGLAVANDLEAFVTYDKKQRQAAEAAGLPLLSPA